MTPSPGDLFAAFALLRGLREELLQDPSRRDGIADAPAECPESWLQVVELLLEETLELFDTELRQKSRHLRHQSRRTANKT